MTWQPYESRGIASIDTHLADKLKDYLDSKETELAVQIFGSIHFFHEMPSISKPNSTVSIRLNESVEDFGKKVHRIDQMRQQNISIDEWKLSAKQIDNALWNYIEVLESCEIELFQQLDQINFEHWNADFSRTVASIKDDLTHRLDDLMWAIRRLEQQLSVLRRTCEARSGKMGVWSRLIPFRRRILDSTLSSVVTKCQKFLGFRYQKFTDKYTGYLHLYNNAEHSLQKLYNYRYLSSMDLDVQDRFKKIYLLLEMWELNLSAKALPQNDIVKAFRSSISPEGTIALFREYYCAVRKGLFDKSRMIKKKFREVFQDPDARKPLIESTAGSRVELHMLASISSKYHDFLLRTDPDPSVRSRLGFPEWIVGPEPKQVKQLTTFINDIEHLDGMSARFQSSLEEEKAMEHRPSAQMEQEVIDHLREMGQPLASKEMMRKHAKSVMAILNKVDELASFYPDTVDYVCKIFCRSLRADWKYHVLQEIPLFHQLYEIHQGIVGPLEERQHLSRLNKFRGILDQLSLWIKHNETLKHTHEIELSINDIKAYLQDFFAHVQSLLRDEGQSNTEEIAPEVSKVYQVLLEYRYLFGNFFHELRPDIPEERLLRKEFLFVDQYFEAIENRLQEVSS